MCTDTLLFSHYVWSSSSCSASVRRPSEDSALQCTWFEGVRNIDDARCADLARSHLRGRHAGWPLWRAGVIGPGSPAGLVDADVAAAGGGSCSLQHIGTCREGPPEAAAGGGVPRLGASSERHIALRMEDHEDANTL